MKYLLRAFPLIGLFITTFLTPAAAQAPDWQWSQTMTLSPGSGGSYNDFRPGGRHVVTDAAGNAYTIGSYWGTITIGSFSLTSSGNMDVYVAKFSPTGQCLWAISGGSTSLDMGTAIAVASNGYVYVGGKMGMNSTTSGSVQSAVFGNNSFSFAWGTGATRAFTARITPTGQWQWARPGLIGDEVETSALAVDGAGNLYLTGLYQLAPYISRTFIAKAVGSTGVVTWRTTAANCGMTMQGLGVDGTGNVYAAGQWEATSSTPSTLGTLTLSSVVGTSTKGAFVTRLTANGQVQWFTQINGSGDSMYGENRPDRTAELRLDATGTPYVAFSLLGAVQLGTTSWNSADIYETVVARVSTAGQWLWTQRIRAGVPTRHPNNWLRGLAVDGSGNAYVAGYSENDWVVIGNRLLPHGLAGDYVAKINAAGLWQWATGSGEVSGGSNAGIAADASGNLYQTGVGSGEFNYVPRIARLTTRPDVPTITSYSPTFGGPGMTVTLNGSNLTGATQVAFADVLTTQFTVNAAGTQLIATVPATTGDKTGPIGVSTPTGFASTPGIYTFWPKPSLSSTAPFSPYTAPPGTLITVSGANFTGATSVKIGTAAVPYTVVSATTITFTVPTGLASGKLTVTTPGGSVTSTLTFSVTPAGSPTITTFSPLYTGGGVGTAVTITGTRFTGATSVKFNTQATTSFTVVNSTTITTTVPFGATTGRLTVTTPAGSAQSLNSFTVPTPTISSFMPTTGGAGTVVTLTGTNFTGATSVLVGTTSLPFTVVSATQLKATLQPGSTTGKFTVTTPNGVKTSAATFTYTGPRPLLATDEPELALSPNPAHERVTLTGLPTGSVVRVLDGQGMVRRTLVVAEEAAELSLAGLPPGLYLVRAGDTTQRLVVE